VGDFLKIGFESPCRMKAEESERLFQYKGGKKNMAQPEFEAPDFLDGNSPTEIQERMMQNLPEDIDDSPGGFPYDFTMPSALEKSELMDFQLIRAIQIAFPQYAWDEWLDMHGGRVGLTRHPAAYAKGYIRFEGEAGTEIEEGTIVYVPETEVNEAIEFTTDEDCVISDEGYVLVPATASEDGAESNVPAGAISIMDDPLDEVTAVINPEAFTGGTAEESDDDFYDRISTEYENQRTYLGNDNDYIRWAKEAGAGDCIVDAAANGPGTVKLVLVDTNGQPADEELCTKVFNYIVSPDDRSKRLLPTACAQLTCTGASSFKVNFTCTGLVYDSTTSIEKIKKNFQELLPSVYYEAKKESVLRYNDIRPLLSQIDGVEDFDEFLINGDMKNITFVKEVYPETGNCDFS
jgi:uncharacterized phage protein gp47/JayE